MTSFKVTFITPHVGRKDPANLNEYVRTWQMENLPVATVAGLTPNDVEIAFFDERVEFIDFDAPTDLAAITIETFNAKRAYEIAAEFRKRGVRVVMGGYHASLVPDEVQQYADTVLTGYAEDIWPQLIRDAQHGRLQPRYARPVGGPMTFGRPDRTIFGSRNYLNLALAETGRGCPLRCNFCSITAATGATYHPKPVDQIIADVDSIRPRNGMRNVFFVDDNIVGNTKHAKNLFRELAGHKTRWFSQGTLSMARDDELLQLMADSGCVGVLIGFESLNRETLLDMNKRVNVPLVSSIRESVKKLHDHGIAIYGTFIFGYNESRDDFERTAEIALDLGLFMAAFNHLIPFPGTGIYQDLLADGRLKDAQWYLDPSYRFGDVPFQPANLSARELREACLDARRAFYSWRGIGRRAANLRGNLTDPIKAAAYLYINWQLQREVVDKDGIPLGNLPVVPPPLSRLHGAEVPV